MNNLSKIWPWILSALAALLGYAAIQKKRATKAEDTARQLQVEATLAKIDDEVRAKPLDELIADNNKRYGKGSSQRAD